MRSLVVAINSHSICYDVVHPVQVTVDLVSVRESLLQGRNVNVEVGDNVETITIWFSVRVPDLRGT